MPVLHGERLGYLVLKKAQYGSKDRVTKTWVRVIEPRARLCRGSLPESTYRKSSRLCRNSKAGKTSVVDP